MRTAQSLLLAAACIFLLAQQSTAQDSTAASNLSLGRLSLKKEFTQSITIKGTDLERMPFASLSDALQAWSFGYLATDINIIYAIDGVIINDVNMYSKYDIEEVVLVQNALSTLNGATATQILALVKTRQRGPKTAGFTVAGQSYQVRADAKQYTNSPTTRSDKNYFHNYQLAGYLQTKSIQFRVSANYLRDVAPGFPTPNAKLVTPVNSDRFGLNAWLQAQLTPAHELTVRINATPQITDYGERSNIVQPPIDNYNKYHNKATIINPSLGLRSRLATNLTNELTASFATGKGTIDGERLRNIQGTIDQYSKSLGTTKATQWVITDQITYHARLKNDWSLDPSLNLFYRHVKYESATFYSTIPPTGGLGVGSITRGVSNQKGGIFLATPSVNLYYRKVFNLQVGVLANLSKTHGAEINKVLPFATTSIDVAKLIQPDGATSLQLFGSIGQSDNQGDYRVNVETTFYVASFGYVTTIPTIIPFQQKGRLWNWQTGTRLRLLNGRITANYSYENRNYRSAVILPTPGMPSLSYAEMQSTSHQVNLQGKVLNNRSVNWLTSLSASATQHEIKNIPFNNPISPIPGISFGGKSVWNGGWANRFTMQHLTAGIDVLYYFNREAFTLGRGAGSVDVVSLANVYVGYVFSLKGGRSLEIYADSRNPAQDRELRNSQSYKYYGLGFKAML